MRIHNAPIAVIGGSGFIGRYIVAGLAKRGARLRLLVRNTERAKYLLPLGVPGQIALMAGSATDGEALRACVAGCHGVVNTVGIISEARRGDFNRVHAEVPQILGSLLADAATSNSNKPRLIHISALGVDKNSKSKYARSKADGETRLKSVFPRATILRPSLVFGTEDDFFNRFASIALVSPILPLIGGGRTAFQPVYVGDVAGAAIASLGDEATAGKTYNLAGGQVYSFAELMRYILATSHRRRLLLPVPFWAMVLPAMVLGLLPKSKFTLTLDQLRLLKTDSVLPKNTGKQKSLGLVDLGISPLPLELVVPQYLARFQPGGGSAKSITNRKQ